MGARYPPPGVGLEKTRLSQDFDVRNYMFDSHLRAVDGFDALTFDGVVTSLHSRSLSALTKRFPRLPLGRRAALDRREARPIWGLDWTGLPADFPWWPPSRSVARRRREPAFDQSDHFESAPVVIRADVSAVGFKGEPIVAVLE